MRLTSVLLVGAIVPMLGAAPTKPAPFVIRELGNADREVCAEYVVRSSPRSVNRSCVPAAMVREWILANGRSLEGCP